MFATYSRNQIVTNHILTLFVVRHHFLHLFPEKQQVLNSRQFLLQNVQYWKVRIKEHFQSFQILDSWGLIEPLYPSCSQAMSSIICQQYPASPQLYFQFTLFQKNFNTGNYCVVAKALKVKLTELELVPFKTIIDNKFNFPEYTLNFSIPYNENDANYFDYLFGVQDRGASVNRRDLRLGFKSYNTVSYVFAKLSTKQNQLWNRYQDINFTLQEFHTIYELVMLTHLDSLSNFKAEEELHIGLLLPINKTTRTIKMRSSIPSAQTLNQSIFYQQTLIRWRPEREFCVTDSISIEYYFIGATNQTSGRSKSIFSKYDNCDPSNSWSFQPLLCRRFYRGTSQSSNNRRNVCEFQ